MHIFVDAMGGDNAPTAIVQGAVAAVNDFGISLTLVGKKEIIEKELSYLSYDKAAIHILHADSVIGFDEEPVKAIRRKKDSSMVVAFEAMKGLNDAVLISAGSTGALLAGGIFKLGRIKGIKRPAVAVIFPREDKNLLIIDVGANADCKPEYLSQFALIGSIYCECVMGIENPKVGLVNIGIESEKGNTLSKESYTLLLENSGICFLGNVEARDIPTTEADIIVCDGFTGNVVLKLIEGLSSYLFKSMKNVMMGSIKGKIGGALIQKDLKKFKKKFDADEIGGTPFLGVQGGVIKAHGSSNAYAIRQAIAQGVTFVESGMLKKLTTIFAEEKENEDNDSY